MTYSVDVNDNTPEWGWCRTKGCPEPAEPFWFTGEYPDDPDLLLCYKCIGRRMGHLIALADAVQLYFNNRGVATAYQKGNEDIAAMSEALADYGIVEQG